MDTKNIETFYPLSPMQQGMLFHSLYAPETGVYVELLHATLRGPFDVAAFERTWQRLLERHPILRTAFAWEGLKEPIQVVMRQAIVPLERQDWRALPEDEQRTRLESFLEREYTRGFDLTQAPLMRLALLQTADDAYEFVWTHHHILLDGWSIPLLLREVFTYYDAFSRGTDLSLPVPRPFRDYIAWLRKQDLAAAESYWRQSLQGFIAPTPLVVARRSHPGSPPEEQRQEPGEAGVAFGNLEVNLPEQTTAALQAMARQYRLTLNTVVQGAWALLLSRYSGEPDVCFGATVSGRPADLSGADSMVGLFINTLPVRVQAPPEEPVADWLQSLQARQAEMRHYEYTPLMQIQGWSDVPRGMPLFETIYVFENFPIESAVEGQTGGALGVASLQTASHTNYPLTVVVVPDREMLLKITYDDSLFDGATIERMMGHLRNLLRGFAANPRQRLADVPIVTEAERRQLLFEWNDTSAHFPQDRTIHEWVEAQTAKTPDAVALSFKDQSMTYRELNENANRLAHYLRRHGVGPDAMVGLYVERSLEMVIGILGILKAGGAYVPMDPAYPPERLTFMLEDTQAPVLLTQAAMLDTEFGSQLAALDIPVVQLDRDWPAIAEYSTENVESGVAPLNTAYVIFTSGSTGRPKGVMVTHANVGRLFTATEHWYGFDERDVWTLFHSYAFDFSVWELWGALFYGGRVVVVPYVVSRSPEAFYDLLVAEGVTVLNQTPSAFRQLIRAEEAVWDGEDRLALRYVIFGGESLELESLRPWYQRHGDRKPVLVNMYGITETTVHVTYRPLSLADVDAGTGSVIGVPIPDLQAYIVDANLQLVPIGVPGEICVGGAGLARGYLNRPELTAQRFVASPFSSAPEARLYRSGDLARYLPDGDIEYLGRIDHQVKIRGFRVELGEIETVLTQHPGVRESVVLARDAELDPGHKQLAAYFVPVEGVSPTVSDLRSHLGEKLPDYMVPAAFVTMERLPLTANGKVDRRALLAYGHGRLELGTDYVSPRTADEEKLAAIWAQMLKAPRVGIHDNFFELGGDSILAIQIVGKARQAGIHFGPRLLFENPTIAGLFAAMAAQRTAGIEEAIAAEQGLVTGPAPLTPIQHWFFEHHPHHPNHFNTSLLMGIGIELDTDAMERALRHVLAHHDALRLRFERTESGWSQVIADLPEQAPLSVFDLAGMEIEAQTAAVQSACADLQAGFDLARGPLIRVAYFNLGTERPGRLLIVLHHLVTDGVSMRILLSDLLTCYQQLNQGHPAQLPAKTSSYREWARRLAEVAQSDALKEELSYWRGLAAKPVLPLPVDLPDGANTYGSTDDLTLPLSVEETQALLKQVPATFGTQINDVLLTALVRTVGRWTGRQRLLVEMEGHGREAVVAAVDPSRTIGWFTSIFPVLLDLEGIDDLGRQIQAVKRQLDELPNRGIGYGLLRYLCDDAQVRADMAALPHPQINFNYLGQFNPMDMAADDAEDEAMPSMMGMAPESAGPEQHPDDERSALLYAVAVVTDGGLDVRWLYSRGIHRRETIDRLAREYMKELREIISHSA